MTLAASKYLINWISYIVVEFQPPSAESSSVYGLYHIPTINTV